MISLKHTRGRNGLQVYSKLLSELKGKTANLIMTDTVNKSLGTFRTHTKKTISKKIGVAQKMIAPGNGKKGTALGISGSEMKLIDAPPGRRAVIGKLRVKGNRVRLIHHVTKANQKNRRGRGMTQKGAGIKAKPFGMKKQRVFDGAFIAPMPGSGALGVFKRKSDESLPVKQLYGGGSGITAERSAKELVAWLKDEVGRQAMMISERRINKAMGK
mgnify:CR=1 FL=1|tara:strand:- start:162 stop:806 length:645 start_codon:yes stop_codon:yes gene_type:complete